jgi:WhiB family transcriptional regulator, redox-sensing transcriptional regulator
VTTPQRQTRRSKLVPPHVPPPADSGAPALPCERIGPALWFAERPGDLELAKRHCQDCPVRQRCLAGALRRAEPWGVWGGEILIKGAVVATKRGRGRPPHGTAGCGPPVTAPGPSSGPERVWPPKGH